MPSITPTLEQWIKQWKLDDYEVDTLLAVETMNTQISEKHNTKQWKEHLAHLAQTNSIIQ
jgi:hypothetical protein